MKHASRFGMLVLVAVIAMAMHAQTAADNEDAWRVLGSVQKEHQYHFLLQNGECLSGRIVSFSEGSLVIRYPDYVLPHADSRVVELDRKQVLQVTDGSSAIDIVYLAKSSWPHLQSMGKLLPHESIRLVMRDGKQHRGQIESVTSDSISLKEWNGTSILLRSEVARVEYRRVRPLNEDQEYCVQEYSWVCPATWAAGMGLAPRMTVRIYDTALPQMDAVPQCVPRQR